MTPEQLTRAAFSMEAALARLDIEPGITTAAELAADDAEILPALVDGQPVITPELPTTTAEELYCRLAYGQGHRCKRGSAPEGYLEIWPDWSLDPWVNGDKVVVAPVILYISFAENAKLHAMLDARPPVITPEPNSDMSEGRKIQTQTNHTP